MKLQHTAIDSGPTKGATSDDEDNSWEESLSCSEDSDEESYEEDEGDDYD